MSQPDPITGQYLEYTDAVIEDIAGAVQETTAQMYMAALNVLHGRGIDPFVEPERAHSLRLAAAYCLFRELAHSIGLAPEVVIDQLEPLFLDNRFNTTKALSDPRYGRAVYQIRSLLGLDPDNNSSH